MELETLKDLYLHELQDLFSAETQLVDALPKMAKAATSRNLAQALEAHLAETNGHVERLEGILKRHNATTDGTKCNGMEGLIEEGDEIAKLKGNDEVRDAGIITAAQRVEHYEIAGYGGARAHAEILGDAEGAKALQTTLDEEGAANKKLTALAKTVINSAAGRSPNQS